MIYRTKISDEKTITAIWEVRKLVAVKLDSLLTKKEICPRDSKLFGELENRIRYWERLDHGLSYLVEIL